MKINIGRHAFMDVIQPVGVITVKGRFIYNYTSLNNGSDFYISDTELIEYYIEQEKTLKHFMPKKNIKSYLTTTVKLYKISDTSKSEPMFCHLNPIQTVYLKFVFNKYWFLKENNFKDYLFPVFMLLLGYLLGRCFGSCH